MKKAEHTGSEDYAGFWVRAGSIAIDGLILSLVTVPGGILFLRSAHPTISSEVFFMFLFLPSTFLVQILYFGWFNADGRQSPGKNFFGLMVVDGSLKPVPLSQSLWRAVTYIIDVTGLLLVPFNRKKRALHDILAKTFVVRIKTPRNLETTFIISALAAGFIMGNLFANILRNNYVQAFRIPTGSLKPTLLAGDFILVDKYWAKKNVPQRGDMIVFKYPMNANLDYIERCIGLAGDTVKIRDGLVWVNDMEEHLQLLTKEYDPEEGQYTLEYEAKWKGAPSYRIRHYEAHNLNAENFGPLVIPPKHYFVMGDNRDNSSDSRYWGFVPQENIVGKAGIIYWSWDRSVPLSRLKEKIRWSRLGNVLQ
ncbi:signal peptidase I [candidate division KSB1 bacterium]|nr:signal peptidase I [candidate division KSB1 bacterium]